MDFLCQNSIAYVALIRSALRNCGEKKRLFSVAINDTMMADGVTDMVWDGTQRRKFVRGDIPFKLLIYTPEGHVLSTFTQNISRVGVRVVIGEKLEVSSRVTVDIYLEKESTKCEGRVVWVKEKENPHDKETFLFETGIEFSKPLSDNLKK